MDQLVIADLPPYAQWAGTADMRDADADFLLAVAEGDASLRGIFCADRLMGIADMECGQRSYLHIYIFPQHRGKGYGTAAAALLEQQVNGPETEQLLTCYRVSDPVARAFAERRGYVCQYASDYMVYGGPPFGERAAVRGYRDEDFPTVLEFYAMAFHLMRLGTGCFPDSVPIEPDEEMRLYWAKTAGERLVYELDGEIVGYLHVEGDMLDAVAVAPERQGEGIGGKLVRCAVDRILGEGHREVGLYCVVGNPARRLYERLGFHAAYRNAYAVKRS